MKRFLTAIIFIISLSALGMAQVTVEGHVENTKGEPLPGVNILVKGTNQGTITDIDGNYQITDVPETGTLVFSFLGMLSKEVKVQDKTQIDVVMTEESKSLDEVVVIGYGDVKRENLLGSVSDISSEEINELPAGNLSTLLEGRLAGVHIGQSSGKPGASTSLSIRTTSSINGQPPLFVVDGVVYDDEIGGQSRIDVLDPSEIESISVLKDASAAIYGARGAGGVVIVRTKRGSAGKPEINYSSSYGYSDATEFPEMMSAYEQAVFINDALHIEKPDRAEAEGRYYTDDELEAFKDMDHNWLEEAWKPAYVTRHALNISGGNERLRYFGGGTYYYETGNFDNLYAQKYTLRMGMDANITDNLTASLTINADNRNNQRPYNDYDGEADPLRGTFKALLQTPKWIPPYIDGLPVGQGSLVTNHPLEVEKIDAYARNKDSHYNLNSSLEYQLPWIQGLKVGVQYSFNQGNGYGKQYRVPYELYDFATTGGHRHIITDEVTGQPRLIENGDEIQESYDNNKSYQLNGRVSYDRKFGLHNINALLVYEQAENEGHGFNAARENMLIPNYERQEGFLRATDRTSSDASNGARLSYIGRLNYRYAEKYLLEAAFRYEGSVFFPPETRWGLFPSVALGWRISEEPFFKENIQFIRYMQLRGTAGLVGDDKVGAARQWEQSYNQTGGAYIGGSSVTNGVEPRNSGVTLYDVTWEKTESYNAGLDMRFVNNIRLSFDGFYRYTYDILNQRRSTLPTSTGINEMPRENYSIMSAWGWETEIGYDVNIGPNWRFHVGGNLSYSRSKVLRIFQNPAVIGTWVDEIGKMPNGEVGYYATGIIRTQEEADALKEQGWTIFGKEPEPGMLNYKDMGSANYSDSLDNKIDGNDKRILERFASPPFRYGYNLGTSWKNIRFSVNLSGSFGHKVFMEKEAFILPPDEGKESSALLENLPRFWADHWTPDNPDAAYPRPYDNGAHQRSTFWARPGHTLRVSSMTLSYQLPASLSEKINVPSFSVNLTARNLWTIINPYDYKDPNLSKFNGYPLLRTINLGVNLTI